MFNKRRELFILKVKCTRLQLSKGRTLKYFKHDVSLGFENETNFQTTRAFKRFSVIFFFQHASVLAVE